jgi:CPA1 family monovalent cation:H+ antiporter
MSVYSLLCFLAAIAVFIAFINHKVSKIQTTITITAVALLTSIVVILLGQHGYLPFKETISRTLSEINFGDFLLKGILGFLLFAGGLGINLTHLKNQKWEITTLSLLSTLISTFLVGFALWGVCHLIGIPMALIYCLVFGAVISPTDPIAVLAIVKKLQAPEQIAIQIEGESLFNDGFGLVLFVTLFTIAFGEHAPTVGSVITLFVREALGGIAFGFVLGFIFDYLIRKSDDPSLELLLTLLVPTAGYAFAELIGVSAPLAVIVTGIFLGNWTRNKGFSETSKKQLGHFWELVDEFINGILFLLIGLMMVEFTFHAQDWLLMGLSIPMVLICRYISIKIPYLAFQRVRTYNPLSVQILTWGGLRGALALAMALSIPSGIVIMGNIDVREIIVMMTYGIVVFSILVQGTTITPMIEKAKLLEKQK